MPMTSAARFTPWASRLIGNVEVFEPSRASGRTKDSASASTACLSSTDSKTASICITPGQVGRVGSRCDPRQGFPALTRGEPR